MSLNAHRAGAIKTVLVLIVTLLASGVQAAESAPTPVQLALWDPLQVFDNDRSVRGFRYSLLWGVNQDVSGLDISTVASRANGNVRGFQWPLFVNDVSGDFIGVQTSALNIANGGLTGLQLGIFGADTRGGRMRGIQLGLILGSFSKEVAGFQSSLIANSMTSGRGLQVGGIFNVAEDMKGLQLGLINFNENGFLPVFPLFNFGL
jgi:hypothetical protein